VPGRGGEEEKRMRWDGRREEWDKDKWDRDGMG
jgi:hypothetical protein